MDTTLAVNKKSTSDNQHQHKESKNIVEISSIDNCILQNVQNLILSPSSINTTENTTAKGRYIDHKFEEGRLEKSTLLYLSKDLKIDKKIPPGKNTLSLLFVNGIQNSKNQCIDSASKICTFVDSKGIFAVYNSTGGLTRDLKEWFGAISKINGLIGPVITHPVLIITNFIRQYFEGRPYVRLIIIAHSQGCLHVKNALHELPNLLAKKIWVVQVAPAPGSYLKSQSCYRESHITSNLDPIGSSALLFRFGNVKRLKADSKAKWFDHSFDSPTYLKEVDKIVVIAYYTLIKEIRMSLKGIGQAFKDGEIMMSVNVGDACDSFVKWLNNISSVNEELFEACVSEIDNNLDLFKAETLIKEHLKDKIDEIKGKKQKEIKISKRLRILNIGTASITGALTAVSVVGMCLFPPAAIMTAGSAGFLFGVGGGVPGTLLMGGMAIKNDSSEIQQYFSEKRIQVENIHSQAIKILQLRALKIERNELKNERSCILNNLNSIQKSIENINHSLISKC